MAQLQYDDTARDDISYTHWIQDGENGYGVVAPPGWTLRQIAEDFAKDYGFADEDPDPELYIVAGIGEPNGGSEAWFAFNAYGAFEWETDRSGGARGY